jgi:hypothetical protein
MKQNIGSLMVLALLMAGGCGGNGGDSGGGAPRPPASTPPSGSHLGGLWSGALRWEPKNGFPGGALNVRGLVDETGEFQWVLAEDPEQFFGSQNEQIFGTVVFDGAKVRTSGAIWVGLPRPPYAPGAHWGDFELSADFETADSLSGTLQSGWVNSEQRIGTLDLQYHDSLYERPSSLETLHGTFGTDTQSLSIDEQGVIFYQSAQTGCTGTGMAAVIDPDFNLYRVELDIGNCTGSEASHNGLTFSGLAYLGVNNEPGGGFINETIEMALTASQVDGFGTAYHFGRSLRADRK